MKFSCSCWLSCLIGCRVYPAAHTPDNSFLGFVVEQHLNASDVRHIDDIKRQNQSLVYGKVDNFWKVSSARNRLLPSNFGLFTCETVLCLYASIVSPTVFRRWVPTKVFSIRLRWLHLSPPQGHGRFRRLDVPTENVSLPIWIRNAPCDERRRWKASPSVLAHCPEHLIPHVFPRMGSYSQSVSPMYFWESLPVFGEQCGKKNG